MPIYGEWKNPAPRRCDSKGAYLTWKVAESVAQEVSMGKGELVIAYHCFGIPEANEIIRSIRSYRSKQLAGAAGRDTRVAGVAAASRSRRSGKARASADGLD